MIFQIIVMSLFMMCEKIYFFLHIFFFCAILHIYFSYDNLVVLYTFKFSRLNISYVFLTQTPTYDRHVKIWNLKYAYERWNSLYIIIHYFSLIRRVMPLHIWVLCGSRSLYCRVSILFKSLQSFVGSYTINYTQGYVL